MKKKILWVTNEKSGGIRTYSDAIWSELCQVSSSKSEWTRIDTPPIRTVSDIMALVDEVLTHSPDLIHFQHEYGLFGSKIPSRYTFPRLVREIRNRLSQVKIVASAHTLLSNSYQYPLAKAGLQKPALWAVNRWMVPSWRKTWNRGTWGLLDGVFVHSSHQKEIPLESGCPNVWVVPHFVPKKEQRALKSPGPNEPFTVVCFGYFSFEKGQDTLIQAFENLVRSDQARSYRLILAGGLRRPEDQHFFDSCMSRIQKSKCKKQIEVTGYIPEQDLDVYFSQAHLIVAPFRETSGSGSIVQSLARGLPIVTSDLLLNLEIGNRQPGCLHFYRNQDTSDLANQIQDLATSEQKRQELHENASLYAKRYETERIARLLFDLDEQMLFKSVTQEPLDEKSFL